jgi:hypothetical protein
MVKNVFTGKRRNDVPIVSRNAKEKIARRNCAMIVSLGVKESVGRMFFAMIVQIAVRDVTKPSVKVASPSATLVVVLCVMAIEQNVLSILDLGGNYIASIVLRKA